MDILTNTVNLNADGEITLAGTGPANSSIHIKVGGVERAVTTSDGSGNWSATFDPGVGAGTHEVEATATGEGSIEDVTILAKGVRRPVERKKRDAAPSRPAGRAKGPPAGAKAGKAAPKSAQPARAAKKVAAAPKGKRPPAARAGAKKA